MSNKKVSLLLDVNRGVFIYGLTVPNTIVSMPTLVTGDTYDIELSLVTKTTTESNTVPVPAGVYTGARFAVMSSTYTATSGQYKITFGTQESDFIDYNVTASEFQTKLNTLVKAHFAINNATSYVSVTDSVNKDAFIIQYSEALPAACETLLSAVGDALLPKCIGFIAQISSANDNHNGVVAFQMKRRPVAYVDLVEATYFLNNNTEYARKPFIGALSLNTEEMASHLFGSATGTEYLVEIELVANGSGRETVMQTAATLTRDYIVEGAYYTDPIGVQSLGQNVYNALANAAAPTGANPFATISDLPTGGVWGDITGTLADQTDLQDALDDKYPYSNPNGYQDAVNIANNYYPLNSNPNDYLIDANSDGNTYGRKDGAWELITGGGTFTGGIVTSPIVFDGTSGQYIGKGTVDTARGGNYGISLVCSVGYEFNWQAGWLRTTEQNNTTPRPLYLDSLAGTTLKVWDSSADTGVEVSHTGISFQDGSSQITAAPTNNTQIETTVTNSSSAVTVGIVNLNTIITIDDTASVYLGDDTSHPFPVGGQVVFVNMASAGTVSFFAIGTATVNSAAGHTTLPAQYSSAVAIKVAANTWVLSGNLA